MRVILDSNVYIAAIAARGLCEAVVELCLEQHELICCNKLLNEIKDKMLHKLKTPRNIIDEYLHVIGSNADIMEPENVRSDACRDPEDLFILGLINPGNANVIVSGDKDLLSLESYNEIPIMSPRQFWEQSRNISG